MQKAEAVVTTSFPLIDVNTCNEFDTGTNFAFCDNDRTIVLPLPADIDQTPTDSSNTLDILIDTAMTNDCDESNGGNNLAFVTNEVTWLIGPTITQTNDPSTDTVGTNVIDITGDDDLLNNCDESGTGNAGDVVCTNID